MEQQEANPNQLFSQQETLSQLWSVPRVQAFWDTPQILSSVAAIPQLSATQQLRHMVQWVKSAPWYKSMTQKRPLIQSIPCLYQKTIKFVMNGVNTEESRAYFLQERAVPYSHTGNSLHMLEMNQIFLTKNPVIPTSSASLSSHHQDRTVPWRCLKSVQLLNPAHYNLLSLHFS